MAGDHLKAAADALQALDAETLVGLHAEGFVFEDTATQQVIETRYVLRGYFDYLFSLPNTRLSDVAFFRCRDRGGGTWVWSGTNHRGKASSIRGASIFEVAEDGIKRETIFYDPRLAQS